MRTSLITEDSREKRNMMHVGQYIRAARIRQRITQAQLAAPEFSASYISAIERRKFCPSPRALNILVKRLGISLDQMLEDTEEGDTEASSPSSSSDRSEALTQVPERKPVRDDGNQASLRTEVQLFQASVFLQQRAFSKATSLLASIHPEEGMDDQQYHHLLLQGHVAMECGHALEAITTLCQTLHQGEILGDVHYIERARNLLACAHAQVANYLVAIELHQQCLAAIEGGLIDDPFFHLTVVSNLANDYYHQGAYDHALTHYQQASALAYVVEHDIRSWAMRYMEISERYMSRGLLMMARDYAMRALTIYMMCDEHTHVGMIHHWLGKTYEQQNNLAQAEQEYRQAIEIVQEIQDDWSLALCTVSLAEFLLKSGRQEEAMREALIAAKRAQACHDQSLQGQALVVLACVEHRRGDSEATDSYFQQALGLLENTPVARPATAAAYLCFAAILEERGDIQGSLRNMKRACDFQQSPLGDLS